MPPQTIACVLCGAISLTMKAPHLLSGTPQSTPIPANHSDGARLHTPLGCPLHHVKSEDVIPARLGERLAKSSLTENVAGGCQSSRLAVSAISTVLLSVVPGVVIYFAVLVALQGSSKGDLAFFAWFVKGKRRRVDLFRK